MVKLSDSQNKLAEQLSLAVVASSHPIVKRTVYGISDIGRQNALVLAIMGLILMSTVCTSSSSSGGLWAGLAVHLSLAVSAVASSHPIVKHTLYGISDIGRKNALVLAVVGLILTTIVCTFASSSGGLRAGLSAFASVMSILAISPTLSRTSSDSSRRSVTGVFDALAEGEHATGWLLEFSTADVVLKMTVGQPEVISKSAFTYPRLQILAYGDLTKLVDNTTAPVVFARSDFGYHVSTGDRMSSVEVINEMLGYNALELKLRQRDDTIRWASYNFVTIDQNYAGGWVGDSKRDVVLGDGLVSRVTWWVGANPSDKYCMAAQWGDNGLDAYNDIGKNNVVKGEMYFNAYGGTDAYCLEDV